MFKLLLGVLLPFLGTSLGASLVFFMRDKISSRLEKVLLGFSAGVMVASSVWSLIIPAIEQSEYMKIWAFLPAVIGVIFGVVFLIMLDKITLKMSKKSQVLGENKKKKQLLFWAITIHNIPEGMAVGIALSSAFWGYNNVTIISALTLSIGIAIQNIPEGAIVSMPLKSEGVAKRKAFGFGVLSGVVEPIFACLTIILTKFVTPILPYLLTFAAGSMIYVSVGELIPEANQSGNSKLVTLSFVVGFLIMMTLDIALG